MATADIRSLAPDARLNLDTAIIEDDVNLLLFAPNDVATLNEVIRGDCEIEYWWDTHLALDLQGRTGVRKMSNEKIIPAPLNVIDPAFSTRRWSLFRLLSIKRPLHSGMLAMIFIPTASDLAR
jgi:hypothetical protein